MHLLEWLEQKVIAMQELFGRSTDHSIFGFLSLAALLALLVDLATSSAF